MKLLDRLIAFILERERIRVRKEVTREPWPWTDDSILRRYRFCNVRRNDDKQTRLIHLGWMDPHRRYIDLWFAAVVARLINWWPTLEEIGFPVPWDRPQFKKVMSQRRERKEKLFTGAYMVRADAVLTGSKADYLADFVLQPMWDAREAIRPREGDTLAAFHARLMQYRDMGSFMAAQVVADLKHFDAYLLHAADWQDWAAPGPGSLRGLQRVFELSKPMREDEWRANFALILPQVNAILSDRIGILTGQDLQNCLCEFDKYERVLRGEGRPRSIYQPGKE